MIKMSQSLRISAVALFLLLPLYGVSDWTDMNVLTQQGERDWTDKNAASRQHWIVELSEAPTLEYRGSEAVVAGQGNSLRPMQATAPGRGGARSFDAQASHVRDYVAFLDQERAQVLDAAAVRLNRPVKPTAVYRHAFNGFAARLSAREAEILAATPGVRSVQPVLVHQLELQYGPDLIGAPALANAVPGATGAGTVIGIIDSGINATHLAFSDDPALSGHTFTNPYGSGQGLCSNPAVACNSKLVGVFDYTTEGSNGLDIGGHGTHVAGIAAGVEWSSGLAGVAPAANLVSWKVCYEELPDDYNNAGEPGCISSGFLQAFESAIELGVDVVNFSIGGSATVSPWADHYGRQILNLWEAGIAFVTSAGNSGPELGTVTFPAYMPWAMAVGSTSHRSRTGRTLRVAQMGTWFVVYGTGPDLSSSLINARMASAELVDEDMLGCTPFSQDIFDDRIAMLRRGECTFETKVNHAAAAGAKAVVMINNVPGDPIIMGGLEETTIPAAMISLSDGEEILQIMNNIGLPLGVDLAANEVTLEDVAWQDRVSSFSSRGPGSQANVLKPNAAAPGQNILSALVPGNDVAARASGTSMASPHVAGAIALLRELYPDWGPDALQSVLETTAEIEPVTVAGMPASAFDRGAGRIRVDRAARAGLFLPVSRAEFEAANPALGGNPGALNLPGILVQDCTDVCTASRTVEALRAGSWTVQVQGMSGVSVTPSSFSLQPGQRRTLNIEFSMAGAELGELREASIRLVPAGSDLPTQHLTLVGHKPEQNVFELPLLASADVGFNRGRGVLELDTVGSMPEAVFNTSALIKPVRETFNLGQDPNPGNPFSNSGGTRTFLVDVPPGTLMLFAETLASSSPDLDLFVGRDANGNGQAELSEMVCASDSPDSSEICAIANPEPGRWWILVQNWQASSPTAQDDVTLEYAVLTHAPGDYTLSAAGPGRHTGGPLDLRLFWDQPEMRRNERWIGAVGFSTTPDELADAGAFPLILTRTGTNAPRPTALMPGQTRPVVLPGNARHETLYVDVPVEASRLRVTVQGDTGIGAALGRLDFEALSGSAPGTPTAPSDTLVSGAGSASGIELELGSASEPVAPGRYYVVLNNGGAAERKVNVKVELEESGRVNPGYGLWSPRDRLIFQGIEWQRGGNGFMTWYSYDEDGLPEFYIAIDEIDEQSSVWQAPLYRVTSNGVRQSVDVVGDVALTTIGEENLMFTWRMNGGHGSEIMVSDINPTCASIDGQPASLTGHWFDPSRAEGGTTAIVTGGNEFYVRYFFGGDGVGRWVVVPGMPSDLGLEVYEFRGFCPNCPSFPMSFEDDAALVGNYALIFDNEDAGNEFIEFTLGEPLNDTILLDVPVSRLSERLECLP